MLVFRLAGTAVFLFGVLASAQPAAKNASVPRLPDGHPDLQGIWEAHNTADAGLEAHSANDGIRAGEGVVVDPPDGKIPYQPSAAAKQKENFAKRATADPVNRCFLPGVPRVTYMPFPFQIFQTPKFTAITYEYVHASRTIYMNGTPHLDDIDFWMGDSRGHWDGDTLVVETTGLRDGGWLDIIGSPQTDAAKVTERFHRINYGSLEIEVTVDDPKAYTKPWTVKFTQRLMPDAELIEFICSENDTSPAHMVGK